MQQLPAIAYNAHALFSQLVADCPPVDLSLPHAPHVPFETPMHLPRPTEDYEDPEDDYATDADSTQRTQLVPAKRRAAQMQSPEQRRRNHHNTHTRRCRARLNWRFDALNRMLPTSEKNEVKHKVHILDHAIRALKDLEAENDKLRLLVALRSNAAVLEWIDSFAPQASDAVTALKPVLDMLTFVGGWPYAEVWAKRSKEGGGMQMQHFTVKSSALLEPALSALGRHGVQALPLPEQSDVVGHVFLHGCAQWSGSVVEQCRDAARQQMLASARLRTCLAVPVPIDGDTTFVVALYDVRGRPEDSKLVDFATFVAVMVGNAFGAAQTQMDLETKIQSTPRVTPKTQRATPKIPRVTPHTPRLTT